MTIQNVPPEGKRVTVTKINPHAFFKGVQVGAADAVQAVVRQGVASAPNDHSWCKPGEPFPDFAVRITTDVKPAYFSLSAFPPERVSRWKGRTQENACGFRVFAVDVEGSVKKYAKPDGPAKGYPDIKAVQAAVSESLTVTGLEPNFIVITGSGGMHLYFVLSECVTREPWKGVATALVAALQASGLKNDAPCTTNAAQIMRAPGSVHKDTGKTVQAYSWRLAPYTLGEFSALVKYDPALAASEMATLIPAPAPHPDGNDLVGNVQYTPYSYKQAAEKCGAMHEAAQRNGRDTEYPVWFLAVKTADLSTEGREFAHDISSGHADYDEATTDKKIESLTGGPASCATWAAAYGVGGPCDTCALRDTIKNPAVQLGALVDTTAPGEVPEDQAEPVPQWVGELNMRYGLVRTGSKMTVADFQTYSTSGRGVGWLDTAAFRQMFKGRLAPIDKPGDKARPLADAWLSHLQRLQYEGLVFAPGETLPANVLNLWQGFAVLPVAGDVSLWLEVLAALVTDESDRLYVLRWIAWKVQNPGGVPDTILIWKGAKGTGKNSLFDPLIELFGRHAMLADDPELIAGRFTWHLMSLAFAVLDEAVFAGNPQQADRMKSRVTAKTMMYEQKGMDPVQGVNRCAYVMLTNHDYVWQATTDERRAVVIEVGESLRGKLEFWTRYHAWVNGDGPAALLHYLQRVDLTGFNPREIPKGEALRKQVEQTALRTPAAAWWHQCLTEGAVRLRDGYAIHLDDNAPNPIPREILRQSYEQSAAARQRHGNDWSAVAKKLSEWAGPAGIQKVRASAATSGAPRGWVDVFPPLSDLKAAFSAATQIGVAP